MSEVIFHLPGTQGPTIRTVLNNNVTVLRDHIALAGNPHGTDLADLGDVGLSGVTDGQILRYDVGTGLWKNATPESGDVTSLAVSGEDPMTGDLTLISGSGMLLTQDTEGLSITIGQDPDVLLNAEKLWGLDVEQPGSGDDGKTLVYDHDTTSYVWLPFGTVPRVEALFPPYSNSVYTDALDGDIVDYSDLIRLTLGYDGSGGNTFFRLYTDAVDPTVVYIIMKWRLPENWVSWDPTQALSFQLRTSDGSGDSHLDLQFYQDNVAVGSVADLTSSGGWSDKNVSEATLGGSNWAAGDILTAEIKLTTVNSKNIDLGQISIGFTG